MPRVTEQSKVDIQSAMIYGPTGCGKTHICATWPRVAWLGSRRELGWKTIENMPPSDFYEGRKPLIFAVSNIEQLAHDLMTEIFPRTQTGEVRTICIETSFYADDVIRSLSKTNEKNGWLKYQSLEEHFAAIDERVKTVEGLRLIYNALASPGVDEKHPSGILIAGRAVAAKLPAMCDLLGYLRPEENGGKIERVLHLTPYGSFPARHRYGNKLPGLVRNPSFRALEQLLKGEATVDDAGNLVKVDKSGKLPALKMA